MNKPKSKKQLDFVFILPFWGSIFVSLILSGYIIIDNNLFPCFSLDCINGFTDLFSLPIKIVSSGMALGAFRILVVRGKQSQKQIDLAIAQNYFRNYIDHKAEFYEELERFEKKYKVTISDKHILYKELFPNNSPLFFKLSIESGESPLLDFLVEEYNKLVDELKSVVFKLSRDNTVDKDMFVSWLGTYIHIQGLLQLSAEERLYLMKTADVEKIKSDQLPKDMSSALVSISELIELMAAFSMTYKNEEYIVHPHGVSDERLKSELLKVASENPPE